MMKSKYKLNSILDLIESLKDIKVLVIGESILDIYCYGNQGSKVRNECLLEFTTNKQEKYVGGAALVANNVASFVDDVTLLTRLGDNYAPFFLKNLNKKIKVRDIYRKGYPTPIKIRYVEGNDKLHYYFKASEMNDAPIDKEIEKEILDELRDIKDYDVVIIIDKGHGMINNNIADRLSDATCKSANTQFNMENKGYSTLEKYPFIDLVTINELELRNLLRDNFSKMEDMIEKMTDHIYYHQAIITLGKDGCIITDEDDLIKIGNANTNPIDPMGAGDALQAVASLVYFKQDDMELTGYLGNLAGAIVCKYPGTYKGITKEELIENLEEIWKQ